MIISALELLLGDSIYKVSINMRVLFTRSFLYQALLSLSLMNARITKDVEEQRSGELLPLRLDPDPIQLDPTRKTIYAPQMDVFAGDGEKWLPPMIKPSQDA